MSATGETEGVEVPPVLVGLGSNLGDSVAILRSAMERLAGLSRAPLRRSSLYRSSPVDCPPGSAMFINAVVALTPGLEATPESLLANLQSIEWEYGRRPKQVPNEARPLDLDLLAFGQQIRRTDRLVLPHPRAHQRRFVLAPLAEIAPNLRLPGWPHTAFRLLETLHSDERVERLP